jgi:acetyl esterase/lipase
MKIVGAALVLLMAGGARIQAPPQARFPVKTYVYKESDGVPIQSDVYRSEGKLPLPVVVWIHGGALIQGSRSGVPRDLLDLCRAENFALVSIDYRLAPEVKLPAFLDDVKDAFRWIRGPGAQAAGLEARKLVVAGGSAGGYLTLMSGIMVEPRPLALVSYWGYGDVDGEWYTTPSKFYLETRPIVLREDALKGVGGAPITGPATPEAAKARGNYYLYLRQNGLWTREVTGLDPERDRSKLDPFCPVRNVTPSYPPTLLLHGTEDTDVPYSLSAAMAAELKRHHVDHEFLTVPGAGHGLSSGDPKTVALARERALAFIRDHLK